MPGPWTGQQRETHLDRIAADEDRIVALVQPFQRRSRRAWVGRRFDRKSREQYRLAAGLTD
jgi:hypothetical protein